MSYEHESLWNKCLAVIKDNVSEKSFNTWILPIIPISIVERTMTVQVPSSFFYEYIEAHYVDLIKTTLDKLLGGPSSLIYKIIVENTDNTSTKIPSLHPNHLPLQRSETIETPFTSRLMPELDPRLNDNYRFENFIEGKGNRLALVAGQSIADNPGKTAFNPLFVFGASGVGKTHLLHAIGAKVKYNHPEKRVLYLSAHLFKTQFMDASKKNAINDFIYFYQTIDVLLIDDIQEFASLAGTQNTFFHIFNHLHQNGKQLVLTSDKPPVELQGMEDRLLTRFKWGLSAELEKPDFELRKAILLSKIKRDGLCFPDDVVHYLAEHVSDNIRDLEGVIISIMARSTFQGLTIDIDLAREVVAATTKTQIKQITIEGIEEVVCRHFKIDAKSIQTRSRKREIVQTRQIIMFLSKKYTDHSLSHIGNVVGKRDHATVLHSCKIVQDLIDYDKNIRSSLLEIEREIKR